MPSVIKDVEIYPTHNSQWIISLKVPMPMETGCYIKIEYPSDLTFDPLQILGSGFFKPKYGDFVAMHEVDLEKREILIEGCYEGVGVEPYGRLMVGRSR
jgi:hypothetical protein